MRVRKACLFIICFAASFHPLSPLLADQSMQLLNNLLEPINKSNVSNGSRKVMSNGQIVYTFKANVTILFPTLISVTDIVKFISEQQFQQEAAASESYGDGGPDSINLWFQQGSSGEVQSTPPSTPTYFYHNGGKQTDKVITSSTQSNIPTTYEVTFKPIIKGRLDISSLKISNKLLTAIAQYDHGATTNDTPFGPPHLAIAVIDFSKQSGSVIKSLVYKESKMGHTSFEVTSSFYPKANSLILTQNAVEFANNADGNLPLYTTIESNIPTQSNLELIDSDQKTGIQVIDSSYRPNPQAELRAIERYATPKMRRYYAMWQLHR